MDTVGHRLVVALASRLFHIFDVRNMDSPEQTRESSLKFLTRALACMSDGQGTPANFAIHSLFSSLTSIALTVTVIRQGTRPPRSKAASPWNTSTPRRPPKRKSMRSSATARRPTTSTTSGRLTAGLAFDPTYNTFASGGSDGTASI